MGQFGSIHAFGYNFAKKDPIWMKSGALRVHCWGLAVARLQIFGAIRAVVTV